MDPNLWSQWNKSTVTAHVEGRFYIDAHNKDLEEFDWTVKLQQGHDHMFTGIYLVYYNKLKLQQTEQTHLCSVISHSFFQFPSM